ncbi:MAG: leucine-rich repeat domain-containing protein, partial [Paludibacteraceae bacterium]|nr:leucine-rich repeat domain-containing protein [Paludibacteraceae bacterium]
MDLNSFFAQIEKKNMTESTTAYSYKIKNLKPLTFDAVRGLAKNFMDDLPTELVDDLYNEINRGVDCLTTESQMLAYLYYFGKMHQAKLNVAFKNLPKIFFNQPEIRIIDYGCGQGIGTMCYSDFLETNGYAQEVKSVTLIEPSKISLQRAALHTSHFFPETDITTINKRFDELTTDDLSCGEKIPTLHILSNVLDLMEFYLEDLAELIHGNLTGYDLFVCVGPYFNYTEKDDRMEDFLSFLGGNEIYSRCFERYELNPDKTWTAKILCFSLGELEEENLSTKVTVEDIMNGVIDEYGVIYSKDGKRLLKSNDETGILSISKGIFNGIFKGNQDLKSYVVKKGTKAICDDAFFWHRSLEEISIPDSVTTIGRNPFEGCFLYLESKSKRFIVQKGLLIDLIEKRLISYVGNANKISIPSSVTNIGDGAFRNYEYLKEISIPDSVTSIGDCAFMGCESLKEISIPNSVTSIGDEAFVDCKSLKEISIPDSVTSIGDRAFYF